MKNVFFALAFMLVGTFAFANTDVTSNIDVDKIESLINVDNVKLSADDSEAFSCGFDVFYDDGGSGIWGGSGSYFQPIDCDEPFDIFGWLDSAFPGWDWACINC